MNIPPSKTKEKVISTDLDYNWIRRTVGSVRLVSRLVNSHEKHPYSTSTAKQLLV